MSDIPLVVIGCVREIEKRGLDEVGIYRLSGATTDVRKLRQAFEESKSLFCKLFYPSGCVI